MYVKSVSISDGRWFWYKKYKLYIKIYQRLTIDRKGKVELGTSLPSKPWEEWAEHGKIESFRISPDAAEKICKRVGKTMFAALGADVHPDSSLHIEYSDATRTVCTYRHDQATEELSDYVRETLNRYDLFVPCACGNYVENTRIRNAALRIIKERASRMITLSLRHKPHVIGIVLDEYGWADVDELIACVTQKKGETLTRELLEDIVETDKKHTFSFNEDKTKIRVNEKHTFPVKQIANEGEWLVRKKGDDKWFSRFSFKDATPFLSFVEANKEKLIGRTLTECWGCSWTGGLSDSPLVLVFKEFSVIVEYYFYSNITIWIIDTESFHADPSLHTMYKNLPEHYNVSYGIFSDDEFPFLNCKVEDISVKRFSHSFEINASTGERRPDGGDYFSVISIDFDNGDTLHICAADAICDGYIEVW